MSNTIHQITVKGRFSELLKEADKAIQKLSGLGSAVGRGNDIAGTLNGIRDGIRQITSESGKATQSLVRLQRAMVKDTYRQQKLGASAAPMTNLDFGNLLSDRYAVYKNFGLSEYDIADILSGYQVAQQRAIENADRAFREQVKERTRQLTTRANNIAKELKVDGSAASDSKDVYEELAERVKSAQGNVVAAISAMATLRGNTRRAISREIEKLRQDALSLGRAIKQSDVDKVGARIQSQSDVLGATSVAQLQRELATVQKTVADTLRTRSVESLRKAVEREVTSAELTVKQLQQQLNRFREGSKEILTSTRDSMSRGEFQQVLGNLIPQLKAEKENLHKAFRQPILNTLQTVLRQAQIDIEQLRSLRQMFGSVGGDKTAFTGESVAGIYANLRAKVEELKKNGEEFPRALTAYYANLLRASGESGAGLRQLVAYIKQQAAEVNANADSMRIEQVKKQIRDTLREYNKAGQVISEAIMQRLQRDYAALGLSDSFKASFNSETAIQSAIRAQAKVKQAAEGIWKPLRAQLESLEKLRLYEPSSYQEQIGPALLKQLEERYRSAIRAIRDQLRNGTGLERVDAHRILRDMSDSIDSIGVDVETKVYNDLNARLRSIRQQFTHMRKTGDRSALPNAQREYQAILKDIDAFQDQEMLNRARRLMKYRDAVVASFAKDDTLKRAEQMLKAGTRRLGGEAALQLQLDEISKAQRDMANAVKEYDRKLAAKIRLQSLQLRQQARDQFAAQNGGRASGSGSQQMVNGMPIGMYQNYLRQLPMQITDIVVGLSTGQRPLYVLLQQGGQLKDMFNGIGNAVKEVAKYIANLITPTNMFITAIGGAAVAIGVLVRKAANLQEEMLQTNVVLNGAAGRTFDFDTVRQYGIELSNTYAIMERDGRKAVMSLAQNARLPEKLIKPIIENVRDLQAFLGKGFDSKGLQETLDLLSKAFTVDARGSFHALAELFDSIGGWDKETANLIEDLFKLATTTKDAEVQADALQKMLDILRERAKGATDNGLTPFQRETEEAKRKLIQAWETLSDNSAWISFANGCASAGAALLNFASDAITLIGKVMSKLNDFGSSLSSISLNGVTGAVYGLEQALPKPAKIQTPSLSFGAQQAGEAAGKVFNQAFNAQTGMFEVTPPSRYQAKDFGFKIGGLSGQAAGKAFSTSFSKQAGYDFSKQAKAEGVRTNLTSLIGGNRSGRGRGGGRSRAGSDVDKDLQAAQRYLEQLKEEWLQVSKMNKEQRLEYDLMTGKVKLQGEMLSEARQLSRAIDERARKELEIAAAEQIQTRELEKQQELENRRMELMNEVMRLSTSDHRADYAQSLLGYQVELQRNVAKYHREMEREIERARRDGKSDLDIDVIRKKYEKLIEIEKRFNAESVEEFKYATRLKELYSADWTAAYQRGLAQIQDWLFKINDEVSSAVENWADGMADALANFVRTGKLSFSDFANSVLDDIAKIASRQLISALMGGFQYGFGAQASATAPEIQKVWVMNQEFHNIANSLRSGGGGIMDVLKKIPTSFSGVEDIIRTGGYSLNGDNVFELGSDPWGMSNIPRDTVERIGSEVSPVIKEGASSMFGGLFNKIGSIFSGIGNTISNLFSGINFSGGGGMFSGLFSSIGGFFGSLFGFAKGGYTGAGGKYTPAGLVHAGEYVINAASTRKLGLDFLNQLNGYADGGYVSARPSVVTSSFAKDVAPMEVNIYNNSENNVRTQRNASGGLDVFIEQAVNAVAGNIAAGGNVAAVLQRTYALNRGSGMARSGY